MQRRDFVRLAGMATAYAAVPTSARGGPPITVAAAGDCILTRRVSQIADPSFLEVVRLLRDADCAYGNCELVMADAEAGFPTAAGSSLSVVTSPRIADEFSWLGFDL